MGNDSFRETGLFQQHGAFLVRTQRVLDSLIILASLYLVTWFFDRPWGYHYLVAALGSIVAFVFSASFSQFYRSWRLVRLRHEIAEILIHWSLAVGILTFALYFGDASGRIDPSVMLYWFVFAFLVIAAFRCSFRLLLRHYRAFGRDRRNVALFGANDTATRMMTIFAEHPWMGMCVLGVFDDRDAHGDRDLAVGVDQIIGGLDALVALAQEGRVDAIYITLPMAAEKRIKNVIDAFSDTTVSVHFCPSLFSFDLMNARWDNVSGQPIISVIDSPFSGHAHYTKRIEDIIISSLALVALAPLLVGVAIAIKLGSPGPVLYRQNRYGLDGKPFSIWKFRSMICTDDDRAFVQARRDDDRITPVGAFLRKTSIDELPQFFNVLVGDMSVVGPRPHPVMLNETHRKKIRRYMIRHKIKPGITGWAQVNGFRGETDSLYKMEKRVEYDLEYIKNWSLWLDIQIIFRTFTLIFNDKHAY